LLEKKMPTVPRTLDGEDLRLRPLAARNEWLAKLSAAAAPGITYNEHTAEDTATAQSRPRRRHRLECHRDLRCRIG
jgi:hypothetical protein